MCSLRVVRVTNHVQYYHVVTLFMGGREHDVVCGEAWRGGDLAMTCRLEATRVCSLTLLPLAPPPPSKASQGERLLACAIVGVELPLTRTVGRSS